MRNRLLALRLGVYFSYTGLQGGQRTYTLPPGALFNFGRLNISHYTSHYKKTKHEQARTLKSCGCVQNHFTQVIRLRNDWVQ